MRDQTAWSFSLGHWLGLPVRMHMFVLLFASVITYLAWQTAGFNQQISTALIVGIGWLSALAIHELGHLFVTAHLGGELRSLMILPWGSDFETTAEPGWGQFWVYLGGSFANFFAAAFGAVVAIAILDASITPAFFNPLVPAQVLEGETLLENALRVAIWSNWLLGLINLTPSFLFDGGYISQGLLHAVARKSSPNQILIHCSLVTQLFAILMIAGSVILRATGMNQVVPSWFGVGLFGLVLMFSSRMVPRRSDPLMDEFDLDSGSLPLELPEFSDNFTSPSDERFIEFPSFDDELEPENDESLSIWLKERQMERVELARQRELEEEKLADAILDKVHREGIRSLTNEDRELLNRVSQRYRNRQREQA